MTRSQVALPFLFLGLGGFSRPAGALEVGQPVPDFSAAPLEGEPLTLSESLRSHKAVAVVFLSTVCPYARYFVSHLRELNAEYGEKSVLILGVNSNSTENAEEVAADARRRRYDFPIVKDEGHRIADILGARVTPEALVIDSEGRLRYRGRVRSKIGSTDLKDALDDVLAGHKVRTPEAKAFGCAIQRD